MSDYVLNELVRQRNAWRRLTWCSIGLLLLSWAFWGLVFYWHCKERH